MPRYRLLPASIAHLLLLINAAFSAPVFADSSSVGIKVYTESCKACHGGGMGGFFSGAPKAGSPEFKARLEKAGSIDALVTSAAQGRGKMPAQGGPKGRSDAEIQAAIETMLTLPP